MHNHICECSNVSYRNCTCANPATQLPCDVCMIATEGSFSREQEMSEAMARPSEFLKESMEMAGGTFMEIFKHRPPPRSGLKGGIRLTYSSRDIEDWMIEISRPRAREIPSTVTAKIIEAPPYYQPEPGESYVKGWADGTPFLHAGNYYYPKFDTNYYLLGPNNEVNMSFFRAVGLREGAVVKIEGVFPRDEIRDYGLIMPKIIDRLYTQVLKEVSVSISIKPGTRNALAAEAS